MAQAVPATSAAIFQDWLDRTADFVLAGNADGFLASVEYPCLVATRTTQIVIAEAAEMRRGFQAWRDMMAGNGATMMVRTARDATEIDADRIAGTYQTDLLHGATRVVPAFNSWMLLHRAGGEWRLAHLVSGLANRSYPFSVLQIGEDAPVLPPEITGADAPKPTH
ncbi:MAG: hypothetical protein KDA73_02820 [Rhodobacteraceae bacterium]|nr:hypothetical protein [Paracoccaceae bacterium]